MGSGIDNSGRYARTRQASALCRHVAGWTTRGHTATLVPALTSQEYRLTAPTATFLRARPG
jgi:hypothetical protein